MPDQDQTQDEWQEQPENDEMPPTEPHSGTPAAEFRFTSGPFSGLTPEEASNHYTNLQGQNQQIVDQVTQYVNQQQQQAYQQPWQKIDGDMWTLEPEKAQQLFQQQLLGQVQQYINQAGQPLLYGQASTAKALSKQDPKNAEVWKDYGREIESLMSRVPVGNQIGKEMWDQAVNIVKANHVDELVNKKAMEVAASMGGTEKGRTVGGKSLSAPQSDAITKIRESDFGKARLSHYSDSKIIEQAKKMGNTVDEYAKMVTSTRIVSHPDKPGEWINKNLVRDV